MRIRSTVLLLAVAMIPVVSAFRARPQVEPPMPSPLPVRWTPAQPSKMPVDRVSSVAVYGDGSRLGISQNHQIMRSDDGGQSWGEVRMPARFLAADVAFTSSQDGFVVGGIGQMLRTRDGGQTWTYTRLPTSALLNGIAVVDTSSLVIVGSEGTILRSGAGGANWQRIPSRTTQHLRDVAFADASFGIAVGMWGTVLVTEDGGRSWQPENSGTQEHLARVVIDAGGNATATNANATVAVRRSAHAN